MASLLTFLRVALEERAQPQAPLGLTPKGRAPLEQAPLEGALEWTLWVWLSSHLTQVQTLQGW